MGAVATQPFEYRQGFTAKNQIGGAAFVRGYLYILPGNTTRPPGS